MQDSIFATRQKKSVLAFLLIFFIGLGIRLYYFPSALPLVIDGMDNFTYATAINYYGHLPMEWSPPNNGWPMFLSFWFSLVHLDNTLQYMQLQTTISIILSSLTSIPIYFLCKKFFDAKIALVGVALFAFDPRIILNSVLGLTEPLFILLGISSIVLFLKYGRRETILSFVLASFCTIVRSEGIFLFFGLTVIFFMKYRLSKEILKTYVPSIVIFLLILSPIMYYRVEVIGYDGIFQRLVIGTSQISSDSTPDESNKIISGLELFIKYLGWIMIPSFLIFLPFGAVRFIKTVTKETNFIIIFLVFNSLPILYAYIRQAEDTRYFYFLYPVFCLISLFAVQSYLSKLPRKNLILPLMITGILIISVVFYEYQKSDYEKEKELNKIAKIAAKFVSGLNFHPSETRYIRAAELPTEWPFLFFEEMHKIKSIPTSNHDELESFIADSRNDLTHLIVDDDPKLPEFLQKVYYDEKKYEYLNKVFDSSEIGFKHNVKIFSIDFQKFDAANNPIQK